MEVYKLESILLGMKRKFKAIQDTSDENRFAIKYLKRIEVGMEEVLEQILENIEERNLVLAAVHVGLGIEYVNIKELKAGEEEFMKCLTLLNNREKEPRAILTILNALNQLGIIWLEWNQPEKAKEFLERAEQIYNNGTDFYDDTDVTESTQWVCIGNEISFKKSMWREALEEVHILIFHYLAQVYEFLKDYDKSALYCHMTLKKQLRPDNNKFDYENWVINAVTLTQYFLKNNRFSEARHHMAAASHMMLLNESLITALQGAVGNSEQFAAEWEVVRHRNADVDRCWARYGLYLLSSSKKRLLQKTEEDDEDGDNLQSTTKPITEKQSENSVNKLIFEYYEETIEHFTELITDQYLLDFNDAKPVFLRILKSSEHAKLYYTLEDHASDYVSIVQDISQAYKNLSFFEEDEGRQAKMHKRRINILESVVKELNPQYYKCACRQIWIELGETYSDILHIKLQHFSETNEDNESNRQKKINRLVENAIKNFQLFLNSLETGLLDTSIPELPEEVLESTLYAYFHLGRLYVKTITYDKRAQLDNIEKSIDAYKFILDYCEKYPDAAEIMHDVISLCKDFVNILPLKANQLKKELSN
ncbi:hypothetical protein KM043_015652 [Ampulex compressa]|nr:hypothetical protein KM043_015652 [Ampulex compressa]